MGGFENELGDAVRVGLAPASKLEAQQQPDDAGDDRRREARRALPCRAAARHRAKDVRARRQHALRPIRQAPVAHVHRGAVRVHRSDGEHRGRRSRHVNAFAAVVADRGDDQHVLVGAILDCAREQRVRLARGGELAGADVDDVGAGLDRLQHRAGDVELGAGRETALVGEDRRDQAGAARRDAPHRAVVLAEDDARDVRAVARSRPASACRIGGRRQMREMRAAEAGMLFVDRPVEDRDADSGIAARLRPEQLEIENFCRTAHGRAFLLPA